MKNEIIINGNLINGRQGFAYICNSMRFSVLKADMDSVDSDKASDGYKTFGKVRVVWSHRGNEIHSVGELEVENGKWSIGGWGCTLKSRFGFSDMVESVEEANLPVIRKDDVVAVAMISKQCDFVWLSLYRVGKIDPHCMKMADLKPLTDEEMQEIKKDADAWCNR